MKALAYRLLVLACAAAFLYACYDLCFNMGTMGGLI